MIPFRLDYGERLNRDVGLRTAAVDYLENIAPPAVAPASAAIRLARILTRDGGSRRFFEGTF
jgi:hypothetical protein